MVPALAPLRAAEAGTAGRFSEPGVVTRVVDGDTLDVALTAGRTERVRVIGIDTPERGACYFAQASQRTSALAFRKRVVLRGDATQDTRDRYGRLLAYVDIGGSQDLGARLVREGYAAVYVYGGRAFTRLASYRAAAVSAQSTRAGVYTACATRPAPPAAVPTVPTTTSVPPPTTTQAPPPPPASACHPNYSKCLPIVSDLDCADVRAMGKAPVQVIGADPYRLDGDNDGLGCE